MPETSSYQTENASVKYREAERVAIVTLDRSIYAQITDLGSREEYFSFMDAVDNDDGVDTILTINEAGSFDEAAYGKLLTSIMGEEVDLMNLDDSVEFKRNPARSRQIYFLRYHLMRRLDTNRLVVDGLQGTVTTPFFGECLSADLRFATPETHFSLCHVKYGLHPTAALAFFLPRFVGHGKATALLLEGGEINAEEALELGLINEIFPKADFEDQCIEAARRLCKVNAARIGARKMIYSPLRNSLESYLETEADLYLASRW